jgi:3-oxoacyl-[acyl-carrier-protein] synthase-3
MVNEIVSSGSFLPQKILTNDDLSKIVETDNEWIVQRTGINKRHIAAENEFSSDMGFYAAKMAIEKAKIDVNDVDLIICATSTPDNKGFPSTAALVQKKLGITKFIPAFDINAACSGFVYAMTIADNMMKYGNFKYTLVIGVDKLSSIVDWSDRSTCVLFGDGAGAILIKHNNEANEHNSAILDSTIHCDASLTDILHTNNGIINMNGREVFKNAVIQLSNSIKNILEKNNVSVDEIKAIIPHQANYRILQSISEKLAIPYEKFVVTVDEHANTSAASIPLAFDIKGVKMLQKGDLFLLCGVGAGFTWGCNLVRF